VAQGLRQGVRQDVSASGLPSSTAGHIHQLLQHVRILEPVLLPGGTLRRACPGADDVTQWRAQSAVFLVHAESPRHAPGRENYNGRRASSFKKRMLSQPEHGRPVTQITVSSQLSALASSGTQEACGSNPPNKSSSVQDRQKARKIIGPEPQTGNLFRLPGCPGNLGPGKEPCIITQEHPGRRKLAAFVP
jgi:hypothetical protein